jgi:hypothetical protein
MGTSQPRKLDHLLTITHYIIDTRGHITTMCSQRETIDGLNLMLGLSLFIYVGPILGLVYRGLLMKRSPNLYARGSGHGPV